MAAAVAVTSSRGQSLASDSEAEGACPTSGKTRLGFKPSDWFPTVRCSTVELQLRRRVGSQVGSTPLRRPRHDSPVSVLGVSVTYSSLSRPAWKQSPTRLKD